MNEQIKPDQALLECRNLFVRFTASGSGFGKKKQIDAVRNVSLDVRKGEVLGLVGESGSGKSTLSKALLGLISPSEGRVLFDDVDLHQVTRKALARRVQPVFQDPYSSLNPRHTLARIIALPLMVHGVGDKRSRIEAVEQMLELVGLPSRLLNAYPSQLSGGQRQRVAIARALILKPEVLVCDEPTSALDVSVQAQILNLLQDLRSEFDLTILFVSHDLAVVEHISDRVAVMYEGEVIEIGNTEDIFEQPQKDYTKQLLSSILFVDRRQAGAK